MCHLEKNFCGKNDMFSKCMDDDEELFEMERVIRTENLFPNLSLRRQISTRDSYHRNHLRTTLEDMH